MNPNLDGILDQAWRILNDANSAPVRECGSSRPVHVGVDLGTAYTVLLVLDEELRPLAGRYQFAQIVRDGLVVDFMGAVRLLSRMKAEVETQLGFALTHAATSYPPGVAPAEVRATQNVLYAAGLECSNFVDEPTAANALLQVENGAVVDVGGGTTGIAIVRNGQVIYTADEPTGGTHFSLVIAGALHVPFETAEEIKKDPAQTRMVFPLVRPVMQKVGAIVARHIQPFRVDTLYLVGGTCMMPGMGDVVAEVTGLPTVVPQHALLVTPIGIAMQDR
jgi:ethanolamine utilization protein EutJ